MEAQEQSQTNFDALSQHVFSIKGEQLFIGGIEIDKKMREILHDEADYILRSRFWEIFNATITNEAADLALMQSGEWNHVLSAKQLYHWGKAFRTMLVRLAK